MDILIKILTGFVALFHFYVMWLEMFAWTTRGKKTFKSLPEHLFEPTKTLAGNQGLYNGFLAAGLTWTFFIADKNWQANVSIFFLSCVVIAGIYGGATAGKRIFFVQALPALLTLLLLLLSK